MSGRSAVVSHHTAIFSPIKTVNLPGSGVFFFHEGKKKNPEFWIKPEVEYP